MLNPRPINWLKGSQSNDCRFTGLFRTAQGSGRVSRWFRHYAGMMRDEKLVRVSIKSKQAIERVLWIWGAILESAAEVNDNGQYDLDAAEVAYFLRADEADICAVFTALADAGRVANNAVVNWGNRQFSSDKSAARVAAHRERKRAKNSGVDTVPTSQNGDVTLPERFCNLPETETELDTEKKIEPKGSCASDDALGLKPEHVVEIWNDTAPKLGKPKVRNLTPERRQLLKARIGQYALEDFQEVFGKIERSGFLRGDNGWHGCTFDWVFKKANFQKILEGNYDQ